MGSDVVFDGGAKVEIVVTIILRLQERADVECVLESVTDAGVKASFKSQIP